MMRTERLAEPDPALAALPTRDRILAAAREVYERNGTRGTTTREIADRAGVNEATLFRHFGNKTALLDEMRESVCGGDLSSVVENLSGDLEADLKTLCLALYHGIMCKRNIIRIALAEESIDPDSVETTWRGPRKIAEQVVGFLQKHVESGAIHGNPVRHASFLMGIAFAFAMKSEKLQTLDASYRNPEIIINDFIDVFLNGVRTA